MILEPLRIESVKKVYRHPMRPWEKVVAVNDLSFRVDQGEIVGFVGHNGAGKTTTIKMLMGFIKPTAGSISVFGKSPDSVSVKKRMGFLPERPYFYTHLTGRELLSYFGRLSGLGGRDLKDRIDKNMERVGLSDSGDMKLSSYSKGMLQRIGIAQAIIHDPDLVVMDEPMSGLDPMGRREVKKLIAELKKEGKTVLFSSHILSDIEHLSDRVLIIEKGNVQAFGDVAGIVGKDGISYAVSFSAEGDVLSSIESEFGQAADNGAECIINLSSPEEMNRSISMILSKGGSILSAGPKMPTLEEIVFSKREDDK